MAQLISTFPALPITWECTIVWEAWTPDGTSQVSGVVITDPVLYGLNLTNETPPVSPTSPVGPFMLVPGPQS